MGNLSTLQNTISRSSGNGQNRKKGNGNGKKPSGSGKFLFEPIEPRLLLSSDLTYAGAAAFDLTLRYDQPTQKLQLIDNATSTAVLEQDLAETSAVAIHGSSEADRLIVDMSSPFDVPGGIIFDDAYAGDSDSIEITGRPSTAWSITGADTGTADSGVSYAGIENLIGGADADIFTLLAGGSISGMIAGETGTDTLDLSADTAGVTVDLGAGTATYAGSISGIENVVTGAGDDTILGALKATLLNTGAGTDTLDFAAVTAGLTITLHTTGTVSVTDGVIP